MWMGGAERGGGLTLGMGVRRCRLKRLIAGDAGRDTMEIIVRG
jgi:hypothetical protein